MRAFLAEFPKMINATNDDGRTALHRAASTGNSEVVAMLIDAKADVNAADRHGAGKG